MQIIFIIRKLVCFLYKCPMQFESNWIDYVDPYLVGILISMAIGFILGLEREYDRLQTEVSIAGLRTFPMVTILGYVVGVLNEVYPPWFLIIAMASFILFISLSQLTPIRLKVSFGLTTNLALIVTFFLGLMVSLGWFRQSVATAVIVVTLLSLKRTFQKIIENITLQELFAFIKFAILALLILPFLPNENFGNEGLLNPFEIGSIVVIVSLLNFMGYFLVKYVGSRKGILLTSILGGLISSTAVTWNYAMKSKENPGLSREYGAGIVIASAVMFPRLILLAAIFNTAIILPLTIPMALLTLICIVPAIYFMQKDSTEAETEIELGNPLNVVNALGFALIYVVILYAVHYGNVYFGESGLYLSSIIAGLADTTAITISMAKFGLEEAYLTTSALVILSATLSNTVVKLGIVLLQAHKLAARLVTSVFGAMLVVGLLYILIKL